MGILEEVQEQNHAYLSVGVAVKMLADMHKLNVEDAAQWLFMNRAFAQIEAFELHDGRAVSSEELRRGFLPSIRRILESIKKNGESHYSMKNSYKGLIYIWQRDEFWQWVKDEGVEIVKSFFTEPLSCPIFLRSKNTSEPEKENAGTQQINNLVQKLADAEVKIKQLTAALQAKEKRSSTDEVIAGVSVTLPHITKKLNALFNIMHTHWATYDVRYPPKSVVIASDIDHAFGWMPQKDGSPSRGGQTFAAAIRPDNLSEADPRNQKRCTYRNSLTVLTDET